MKLYYFPISTYSQKVLIALHEKKLSFEPQITNLMDPAAAAEYRKVYPLGKVPLLIADDGRFIPESSIIIEYLDQHHSGARLIPTDPDLARQVRFHDRMHDLYLNDSIATLVFESWKPSAQRNAELIEKMRFRAGVIYDYMEKHLANKTWVMGEAFTMADCSAAPPLFYAQDVFPFSDRPNISAYWKRLYARPSVKQVIGDAQPYLAQLPKAG